MSEKSDADRSPEEAAELPRVIEPTTTSPEQFKTCWLCLSVAPLVASGLYTCPFCSRLEPLGV